jgi:hypothetical protein
MAPQAAGDVRQDRLTVFEFDRKRGARKNLFDRSEQL